MFRIDNLTFSFISKGQEKQNCFALLSLFSSIWFSVRFVADRLRLTLLAPKFPAFYGRRRGAAYGAATQRTKRRPSLQNFEELMQVFSEYLPIKNTFCVYSTLRNNNTKSKTHRKGFTEMAPKSIQTRHQT